MRRIVLALMCLTWATQATSTLAEQLYWTDKNDATIWRGEMDGSQPSEILLDWSDGLIEPRGLGLDVAAGKMYWADGGAGTINWANLDGTEADQLVSGLTYLSDLELDVAAGRMYWANTGGSMIQSANLDGTGIVNLFAGATAPYYLELDIPAGMMYWGEQDNSIIFRGKMDGTGLAEEFLTGLDRVRDIGPDLDNGRIYWNERDLNQVSGTEIGSGTLETLFPVPNGGKPHGMALDLDADMIYWTTTGTDSIMRGPMDGSVDHETLYTSPGAPWDIELAVVAVPEPSVLILAGLALLGLLVRRRRGS